MAEATVSRDPRSLAAKALDRGWYPGGFELNRANPDGPIRFTLDYDDGGKLQVWARTEEEARKIAATAFCQWPQPARSVTQLDVERDQFRAMGERRSA